MEAEESKVKQETEESIQALQEKKAKILSERKQKLQEQIQVGGSKEEHHDIIKSYDKDTQKLINKIDTERLRVEADLQERLRKRRAAKRKAKELEVQEEMLKKRSEREELERLERQRLAEVEKKKLETLQETLHEKLQTDLRPSEAAMELPNTVPVDLPLSEEQLSAIVLSTPLYQKLEQFKLLLQNQSSILGSSHPGPSMSVDPYVDPKDAVWVNDTQLHAVDIKSIPARAFVVYKFGCCVIKSLIAHCNHKSVSLLVADKIPPNNHFKWNAFRNSSAYDASNRILYIRLERLKNVGEFVLVLVHALSHIKSGSFANDWDPAFVKEFYSSLSVCCNELFLSRFRSSPGLVSESQLQTDGIESTTFGSSVLTDGKAGIIDELLDARLMMNVDMDGQEFSHERIMARLERYSEFKVGSKLRWFLDQTEVEVSSQEKPVVSTSLLELMQTVREPATQSLTDSKSLWQSVAKRAVMGQRSSSKTQDQYKHFLDIQIKDLQQKVEKLEEEYARVSKKKSEISSKVKSLEKKLVDGQENLKTLEEGSTEFEAQKQMMKNVMTKLSATRTHVTTYSLRVNGCQKRMDGFKKQLSQKFEELKECENQ